MIQAVVVGARFLQFASTMILFGSALFFLYGLKDAAHGAKWPKRLLTGSAYVAVLAVVLTVTLQASALGGGVGAVVDTSLMQSMLFETGFGRVLALRLIVSLAALLVAIWLRNSPVPVLARVLGALGALLTVSFAGTGHAGVSEGAEGFLHAAADILHNLAAGVWIGALVPITILIWRAAESGANGDAERAREGLTQFSRIGTAVVALLVLSGAVNSWFLIGPQHLADLFTTTYGVVLVAKLLLFAAMLLLAAANRFRLTPSLATSLDGRADVRPPLAPLKISVLFETGLALLVLLAVSLLGISEPPALSD